MDDDDELHTAWVAKAVQLAIAYREADSGHELRDPMRELKTHFEGRPASMSEPRAIAVIMDEVEAKHPHRLAMPVECPTLMGEPLQTRVT